MRGTRYTKTMTLYALYKNDEFIDVGTADELAARLGKNRDYIQWLATAVAHRRGEGNNWVLAHKVGMVLYERETYRSPWVEKKVI